MEYPAKYPTQSSNWYADEIYRMDKKLRQLQGEYDAVAMGTEYDSYAAHDVERNITNTRKYVRALYEAIGVKWNGSLL